MIEIARCWRILAGGTAIGMAGVLGVTANTASAEPTFPQPSVPGPATVTQPATGPAAAPAAATPVDSRLGAAVPRAAVPRAAVPGAAVPGGAVPAPTPPVQPATSGTLTDFFKSKGVKMEPQVSRDFRALNIVLPMPPGWSQVPDPNVPDAFAVIADRNSPDLYTPNAQVTVYKLTGDFDPKEAISHGLIDSQQQPGFRATDASLADFGPFPSSFIEGTYRSPNQLLNGSRRHVIAASGQDRYLVSLSVTAAAGNQGASTAADATDAILSGFRVSTPTPQTPAAPVAPGAPVPAPAQPAGLPAGAGVPQLPAAPVQPR